MSDIEQKRQDLYKAYPASGNWAKKVREMSETQVVAVYLKFKREGKI